MVTCSVTIDGHTVVIEKTGYDAATGKAGVSYTLKKGAEVIISAAATADVKVSISDRVAPVSIPNNYILYTDEAASEKWVEDMSIATVVTNLDKAGVSGTLIASLQGAM